MDKVKKSTEIAALKERFSRMTSMVLVDYKGMTVDTATRLRVEFRKAGVEYRVVKNTLVKQAIKGTPLESQVTGVMRGMSGLALSYDDPSIAAKVVKQFRRDNAGKLNIRAGYIDGQLLDEVAVEEQLATMPGKNELRAMLLATMQAPLQNFVALLNAPPQNFVYLLDAKRREMGGGEEPVS